MKKFLMKVRASLRSSFSALALLSQDMIDVQGISQKMGNTFWRQTRPCLHHNVVDCALVVSETKPVKKKKKNWHAWNMMQFMMVCKNNHLQCLRELIKTISNITAVQYASYKWAVSSLKNAPFKLKLRTQTVKLLLYGWNIYWACELKNGLL